MDRSFWKGKKVFLTGHTGFKGAWLGMWLTELGADVHGYALDPPTEPSLYRLCGLQKRLRSTIADIRDTDSLRTALREARPSVVVHMAAQPLVRDSYRLPVETYAVNVMGTVNLLEAVRSTPSVRAVINVTTDKCYENREWVWGYRESEPLGGYDPYASSKACSELVSAAYRRSYFSRSTYREHGVGLATARAGNVIGGGDWAEDRIVPDCFRAILQGQKIRLRHPEAIRPWQHVLEPLAGYMLLAQRLFEEGSPYAEPWNFGPNDSDMVSVESLVALLCKRWGAEAGYEPGKPAEHHEAHFLKLDSSKARARLHWSPRWDIDKAIDRIVEWMRAYQEGADIGELCAAQIKKYEDAQQAYR